MAQQTAYVDAAVNIPYVVDSDDDGIVPRELEKMRSILEESMLETRSMPLENRPRLSHIPLSKRNRAVVWALNPMLVTYLEASRDLCETDSILFLHRTDSMPYYWRQTSHGWTCYSTK
ncbi:unnamed protein product [Parnassius apollo]|uniref:(apollo) hypothetical protein n=1 Tax=Parnassius apollo TaxID=110799 RepID=A0A8S3YBE7_PARAO|nr:unnamed protein product [Parnassius apollo]